MPGESFYDEDAFLDHLTKLVITLITRLLCMIFVYVN